METSNERKNKLRNRVELAKRLADAALSMISVAFTGDEDFYKPSSHTRQNSKKLVK